MSDSNWKRNAKDFVAGSVGGVAQVLSGQPFDIVKVQQATSTKPVGVSTIVKQIMAADGVKGFYRGTLPPIMGVGACVSIQFGVKENVSRALRQYNNGEDLSYIQHFISGGAGGFVNSVVSTPAEGMRIIMQAQGKVDPRGDPHYASSMDCIKTVYRNNGLLKGIYRGLGITATREWFCYGTYFLTYEALLGVLADKNKPRSECPKSLVLFGGGMAGVTFWGIWYPIDILKSKIQADSYANPRYTGPMDAFSQTLKNEGVLGFYKGYAPCVARAFPANAATFLAYEIVMNVIGRD